MPSNLMPVQFQWQLGHFWNLVGDRSRFIAVVPLTGGPHIEKQRWYQGQQSVWVWKHQVQSHCSLVDYLEILHWAVIIGAWIPYCEQGSAPGRLTRSQDFIVYESLEVMRYAFSCTYGDWVLSHSYWDDFQIYFYYHWKNIFLISLEFIYLLFFSFIIHMCIQGLLHFSPLPLPPPLPHTPSPPSPPHPLNTQQKLFCPYF
jgi:hypothetical protein